MRDSVVRGIDRVDPFKDFHHGLLERGFDYQDAPSFSQSLRQLRDVKARLDELEKRLDDC